MSNPVRQQKWSHDPNRAYFVASHLSDPCASNSAHLGQHVCAHILSKVYDFFHKSRHFWRNLKFVSTIYWWVNWSNISGLYRNYCFVAISPDLLENTNWKHVQTYFLGQCKARPFNFHRVSLFISFFVSFFVSLFQCPNTMLFITLTGKPLNVGSRNLAWICTWIISRST